MKTPAASLRTFAALDLAVRRRLAGVTTGEHGGLRLGPGSDPEEVVRYQPGEHDVRRIDWNVTARTQEPHVWRTRADHELETWVLVDRTASMEFGTVEVEKSDLALWATAAFGLLTDGPGNSVGIGQLRAGGVRWSRAERGRIAAQRVLRDVGAEHSAGSSATASGGTLAQGLRELERRHRRPGFRVVVSDLLDPTGAIERPFAWEQSLRRLCARHDVLVVEVLDPRELDLPDVGAVVLVDPESGRRREVWTSRPGLRAAYADGARRLREQTAEAVRTAGADHVVLRTDRDWLRDLAHHAHVRRHAHPGRTRRPARIGAHR